MWPSLLHVTQFLAFAESLGLAILLGLRIRGVPGISYLVLFLIGVAAWIGSCETPYLLGATGMAIGRAMVALSPLTAAVFVHFVLVFCRAPNPRPWRLLAYGIAAVTTAAGLIMSPGDYRPWMGITYFFMPNAMGWVVGMVWAGLTCLGHGMMAVPWLRASGVRRRQITAMCLASGWGAASTLGYALPPLGIDVFPYPLLLLPAYPLVLVYGILRYQLMIVNAWARRGLAWTMLVGIGSAAVIGLAALPLPFGGIGGGWQLWAASVATLLAAGLLLDPFRRLATRLVYPGSKLAAGDIELWRAALVAPESFEALVATASHTITRHLGVAISVQLDDASLNQATPGLLLRRDAQRWTVDFIGWAAAPPGPQHVAQLFGTVLTEAATRLEQALALAERERDRQREQRLAELGALAATVAHDIRNPLNIIAMAAAGAPSEIRREISEQTARIARLSADLLDYAKPWQLDLQRLDLMQEIMAAASHHAEIDLSPLMAQSLTIAGDRRRLAQVFANLFDNARVASQGRVTRIGVEAERSDRSILIHICDDGAGIPAEIRETLFQPFVSRSAGGTGLGLAIVAKIMTAHGGGIRVEDRPGWITCFTLTFPEAS